MFSCGTPRPVSDNSIRIVAASIKMRATFKQFASSRASNISLKIGIATGGVIGGILGKLTAVSCSYIIRTFATSIRYLGRHS